MKATLYVVGNGFDLAHGIPSRYSEFKNFCALTEQYRVLFNQINDCLTVLEDSNWNNFEEALGWQDIYALKKSLDRNQNINRDYPIGIDDSLLKFAFRDWIVSVNDWIKNNLATVRLKLKHVVDVNSYFLSFNYTNTLERVYNIPNDRIKHIHGYVAQDNLNRSYDNVFLSLIYGHKNDKVAVDSTADRYTRETYLATVNSFKKDFQYEELNIWLNQTGTINKIIVLGHSMSEIDLGYFEIIKNTFPNANWGIGYFNEQDLDYKSNVSNQLEITPDYFYFS